MLIAKADGPESANFGDHWTARDYSNTTPAMANIVQKLFASSMLGEKGRVGLLAAMPMLGNPVYGIRAIGRTGAAPERIAVPPGVAGAVGAATMAPDWP